MQAFSVKEVKDPCQGEKVEVQHPLSGEGNQITLLFKDC